MKNVLMLLKCNGLKYDDRVRKESLSLVSKGYNIDIHILENANTSGKGSIFDKQVSFKKYFLFTRWLFSGNKLLFIKLVEFFIRLLPTLLKRQNVIWLHDPLMFVFVPFFVILKKLKRVELIIWDQHELPHNKFLESKVFKSIYVWAMKHVDVRIHANEERALHLNQKLNEKFSFSILRNFVDSSFILEKKSPLPVFIVEWLNGSDFILLQSGAHKGRNFESVVESICNDIRVKCIVVGGFDEAFISELKLKHPSFDDFFHLVGMVPQIRLVDYIDTCLLSLILYNDSEPNSLLCEPNRLYQSLSRGTPVVVGSNPTMANIVNSLNCGVVIDGCGKNSKAISEALNNYFSKDFTIDDNIKSKFSWESQIQAFEFLDKLRSIK